MLKSTLIKIDKDKCSLLANEIFLRISGIDKPGEKYDTMKAEAFSVRDSLKSKLELKANYSRYKDFKLRDEILEIAGISLDCKAFGKINPASINEVFIYGVTAVGFNSERDNILRQVYEDLWGTAYADASRKLLMQIFSKFYNISECFGPGFYGMHSEEMNKFDKLVDLKMIGVEVSDSGFLLPSKSVVGMVFIVNDMYKPIDAACQYCQGNKGSCSLCTIAQK